MIIFQYLIMKWSKFIEDSQSHQPTLTQYNKLTPSNNINKDKSSKALTLNSIQKVKGHYNSLSKQNSLNQSFNSSQSKFSQYKQMLNNKSNHAASKQQISQTQSLTSCQLLASQNQEINKLTNKFHRQLDQILKNICEIMKNEKYRKEYKQQLQKRISSVMQQTVVKSFPQYKNISSQKILEESLFKTNNDDKHKTPSRNRGDQKTAQNGSRNNIQKSGQQESGKKYAKIMQFKRNKIEQKNGKVAKGLDESRNEEEVYEKVSNAFEQLNIILQTKREPKFNRRSRVKKLDDSHSRYSNGSQRSVQQVLENTLNHSRKISRSRLKGSDMIYSMSKILNQ